MKDNYYRLERKRKKKDNMRILMLAGIAGLVCVGVIAAAAVMNSTIGQSGKASSMITGDASSAPVSNSASGASSDAPESSKPASGSSITSEKDNSTSSRETQPEPTRQELEANFNFSHEVPAGTAVSLDYFKDAAIIGDSRALGLIRNTGLGSVVKSCAQASGSAKMVLDGTNTLKPLISSLEAESERGKYKKVYIMLGLNEIGYQDYGALMKRYGTIVDRVRAAQPDTIIYLHSVLPITSWLEKNHDFLRKEKIDRFNEQLKKLAVEKKLFYIDPTPVFVGKDGFMLPAARASAKGNADAEMHFNKEYYGKWLEYLKTHTARIEKKGTADKDSAAVSKPNAAGANAPNREMEEISNYLKADFNFSSEVTKSTAVGIDYFKDAAIIGDSRALGLIRNTDLAKVVKSCAQASGSAKMVLDGTNKVKPLIAGLEAEAERGKYKKVYIMLGLNEIGYSDYGALMKRYGTIVDRVRAAQPDAIIYLHSVLPITPWLEKNHSYLRKEKINRFNEQLKKLAVEKKLYYIDASSVFLGENGFMVPEARASAKGNSDAEMHFNKEYYRKWLEYLKCHTIK